ncbi:MAG: TIGR02099 family protein [Gammaproteobacteria bacterium]|nr:TIGR02099 family protein [Gammaproteobacteria bacterium]
MFLRITSSFLRASWWIAVLLIVLIAIYLLLGRLFVYAAATNKEQVESLLHDAGLQYVSLGDVKGDWRVFDPVFECTDVVLRRDEEVAFSIDHLRLRLSSFRSISGGIPVVSEMEASGIRFTLIADDDGVRVKGLPKGGAEFNLDPVLESVPYINVIELNDVDITLFGREHKVQVVSREGEPWLVTGRGESKEISFPLYLERQLADESIKRSRLSLTGRYQGDVRKNNFSADIYLQAPELELSNFLPQAMVAGNEVSSATLSTEAWLTMSPGEVDTTVEVSVSDIGISRDKTILKLVDEGTAQLRFQGSSFLEGQLSVPYVAFRQGEFSFRVEDIRLATSGNGDARSFAGEISLVDVSALADLIQFAGEKSLVPERLSNALNAVDPRGKLQNLNFSFDRVNGRPKVVGSLVEFGMDAYLGVPAIDRLNGLISLQPERGYLDIDNDAFQMYFSNMFPEPWPFDSGRGRISYEVADGQFSVSSSLIELVAGDLEARGKLTLNLPGSREYQTWGLTLGVTRGELLEASRYIPNTIPTELVDWLDAAILGGQIVETGLIIHGALFRGSPKVRKAHDLYLRVEDTTMAYHEDWPVVESVKGTVHVNNYFVRSNEIAGRVLDTDILSARVDVPISTDGAVDTVLVNGDGTGPFSDIVRALNETPLSEITGHVARQWLSTGEMQARIKLNVPVGSRKDEEVHTEFDTSFVDSSLKMPEYDLQIESLQGSAHYSSEKGLSSDGFEGVSFNEPVEGLIQTHLQGDGGEIEVSVNGSISADALFSWSDQILLSRADGMLDYRAGIHVPFGGKRDETYVIATSDLTGMTLDLPAPLTKSDVNTHRDFEYRQYFQDNGFRVDMSLGDDIKASLKIEDGIAVGGRIHFGSDSFGAVTFDRIRMTGRLAQLDYEQWMLVTDQLAELTDVSLEDEIAAYVASVELSVDELLLFSLPLEDASVRVTRGDQAWLAHIDNQMLLGDIKVADDDLQPIAVDLRRISFDEEEGEGDPLAAIDPLEIGDIDFATEHLLIDGENYGGWAFQYRAKDDMARFENLSANAAGVVVLPSSTLEWRNEKGKHTTRYEGDIRVDDLAHAMQKFGFASSIEGKGLKLKANVAWEGSPAMVDVNRVVGSVEIHEGEGRFVQAETGGALKLLGIFDFASLTRRARLDFSDVVNKGFEFSDISGVTAFNEGSVGVTEPIVIEGTSGRFTVGGSVDLESGTLDNELIVTLPVSRTLPWYAAYSAIATGPLAGAGVMIAQKVFENQINQMSSAKYKITGTIDEPNIEFVAIFDDKVAEAQPEKP